jgi:hypothetical protein
LPSFPGLFERLGFTESATDYVFWSPHTKASQRVDLAAGDLGAAALGALRTVSLQNLPAEGRAPPPGGLDLNGKLV